MISIHRTRQLGRERRRINGGDFARGALMKKGASIKLAGLKRKEVSSIARSIDESIKPHLRYKDYLKAVVNSFEDELIVIDRDYRIIQANEAVLLSITPSSV